MAGLLKAIENGYKPTPHDIADEISEIPREQGVYPWCAADYGASTREQFIEKLFNLLGVKL